MPGGALPVLQIVKDLMLLFDEVSLVVLFCQTSCHLPNFVVQQMKDYLIILANKTRVLNDLLPPLSVASQSYNLRQRRHKLELPNKTYQLVDSNFIQQMLYLDSY